MIIILILGLYLAISCGSIACATRFLASLEEDPTPPHGLGWRCRGCGKTVRYPHPSSRGPAIRLHQEFECSAVRS